MTGRDLIVYILSNRLENEKISENSLLPMIHNYMEDEAVVVALGVGVATVRVWAKTGKFEKVIEKERNVYISKDDVIRIMAEYLKKE